MSYKEAEIAKLITNMARYINFAMANDFFNICNNFGVDPFSVMERAKESYPRLNHLPSPGPNVAGPCLYKDGKFLLARGDGSMIREAFEINEGMPQKIVNDMLNTFDRRFVSPRATLILGAAFKKDSDDTRNSLSFKLRKLLINNGVEKVDIFDPLIDKYAKLDENTNYDCAIIMTPHSCFSNKKSAYSYEKIFENFGINSMVFDYWNHIGLGRKFSINAFNGKSK